MLFRRISEHLNQQNWFAVAIDFVVVVLGIFIGMQVTDWNQMRLDRVSERRFLEALHSDLVVTANNINETKQNQDTIHSSLHKLATVGNDGLENYSPEELDRTIAYALWDLSILKVQMDAYQELKSSAGTQLLGSEALRLGLSRWTADLERYLQAENDTMQVQFRNVDNYLADQFPMRRFSRVFDNASGLPDAKADTQIDYAEFISRQQTQTRVTMKYISVSNARNFLRALEERVTELQTLVNERLAELGEARKLAGAGPESG
jgi:hypothetical protein